MMLLSSFGGIDELLLDDDQDHDGELVHQIRVDHVRVDERNDSLLDDLLRVVHDDLRQRC